MKMRSKVALVDVGGNPGSAYRRAVRLIGGIDDLNRNDRRVIIKVGIYRREATHHATPEVVNAIARGFTNVPRLYIAESDAYSGTAEERLEVYRNIFGRKVHPFNLTEDEDRKTVSIAGENVPLSRILFKPSVLVSAHVLRVFGRGSVLKNLLGLVPDNKKARFHSRLPSTLLDINKAVGKIDLTVLDGTYAHTGFSNDRVAKTGVLLLGRDAVAVDAVGYALLDKNSRKIPVIQEATRRGIGVGDLEKIEIVGDEFSEMKRRTLEASKEARKGKVSVAPQ